VVPSDRFVVPSSAALAEPAACGAPDVVSGGQSCAHSPLHVLDMPVSACQRYSVRPWESTSIGPRPWSAVAMRVAPEAGGAAGLSAVAAGDEP
jgi:hypothetical protein